MELKNRLPVWLFLLSLLATVLLYFPGLDGPFQFDDNSNIVANDRVKITSLDPDSLIQAAASSPSSTFGRPISALSFGINHYIHGLSPFHFKVTNLSIHLLNGVLVFLLSMILLNTAHRAGVLRLSEMTDTDRTTLIAWVALLTASFWMLAPLNLSPVLYVVQRMASLSTLFALGGMLLYVLGRQKMLAGHNGVPNIALALLLMLPLSFLSKENGIVLPGLLWIIEFTLLQFKTQTRRQHQFLVWLFIVTLALPIVAVLLYTAFNPTWLLAGYEVKPFTLTERLLTETRVLWFYVGLLLFPRLNAFSLYHDDFVVSEALTSPWTTLPGTLALLLVVLLVFTQRKRIPVLAFGAGFFLMGHSIESTIFPLEIMQEHRNYLPSFGIMLALAFALINLTRSKHFRLTAFILILAYTGLSGVSTALRASIWSSPIDFALDEVNNHPQSARAQYSAGLTYGIALSVARESEPADQLSSGQEYLYQKARQHFLKSIELTRVSTLGLSGLMTLNINADKPIPPEILTRMNRRLASTRQHHPDHVLTLLNLVDAHEQAPDQVTAAHLHQLFSTAIDNPARSKAFKANILAGYSAFQMRQLRDFDAAIASIHRAIDFAPKELQHQMSLINILSSAGRWTEARAALEQLKQQDRYGKMQKQIDQILPIIEQGEMGLRVPRTL